MKDAEKAEARLWNKLDELLCKSMRLSEAEHPEVFEKRRELQQCLARAVDEARWAAEQETRFEMSMDIKKSLTC